MAKIKRHKEKPPPMAEGFARDIEWIDPSPGLKTLMRDQIAAMKLPEICGPWSAEPVQPGQGIVIGRPSNGGWIVSPASSPGNLAGEGVAAFSSGRDLLEHLRNVIMVTEGTNEVEEPQGHEDDATAIDRG